MVHIHEKEPPISIDTQSEPSPAPAPQREVFYDSLRKIAEDFRLPERLDSHPWVHSLTVQDAVAHDPALREKSPGTQLVSALAKLFPQLMPSTPPQRDGKRLDTRWGRFGILAANYFAPLLFGRAYPRSLREAWRRIDQAILLFVYGTPADQLTPDQIEPFKLVGDEMDMAANSTISDWHHRGLQDLADLFASREKSLSLSLGKPSPLFEDVGNDYDKSGPANLFELVWRPARYLVLLALALALILGGVGGYRLYQRLQMVRQDIALLKGFSPTSIQPQDLQRIGPILQKSQTDLENLRAAVSPWLWLTRRLSWVPIYGGDLRYLGDLLDTASRLIEAASQTYQTALPVWTAIHGQPDLKASDLTSMLIKAQPSLLNAQATLAQAVAARQLINLDQLSPATRDLLTRVDSYTSTLNQALTVALTVPSLLGGTNSGPKTYLILIENEDELRPTGGFITAVGKVVVWNGQLMSLSIEDSYSVDDMNKAYPLAPWQMQSFMNIPILVFRDASWFTDYPTAVLWAEYLYAYTNSYSVNGVISIDQHVLATLLSVTGPVTVSQINTTVTSDNIRTVMRSQKVPPPLEQGDPNWYRKQFMNPIAAAILQRLISGHGISWELLLRAMMGELDARHILVQLDDPAITKLLADRGWDGAVRNPGGDFLMVVDTNVGYNKTNAVVSSRISYDVDLSDLASPASSLTVYHQNDAVGPAGLCDQRPANLDRTQLEYWYPIDRCYYNYLRIYVPAGAQLTTATPHAVSRDEMVMLDQDVPARVDLLDETITNVQGFGTLLVVPMSSSLQTSFHFNLPAAVVQPETGGQVYHLKIEKQAGVLAVPVTLRVHLPQGSKIASANLPYVQDGSSLLFNLELKTDIEVQIEFRP